MSTSNPQTLSRQCAQSARVAHFTAHGWGHVGFLAMILPIFLPSSGRLSAEFSPAGLFFDDCFRGEVWKGPSRDCATPKAPPAAAAVAPLPPALIAAKQAAAAEALAAEPIVEVSDPADDAPAEELVRRRLH